MVFNAGLILLVLVMCIKMTGPDSQESNWLPSFFGIMFGIMFFGLVITAVYLAKRLWVTSSRSRLIRKEVRREIFFLIFVLTIFSLSYLLRSIWDLLPKDLTYKGTFKDYMID